MRRILHLVLAAFIVVLPSPSFAAGKSDAAGASARKKKKAKKAKAAEQEQENEAARAQGEDDDESQGSRRKKKRRSKTIEVAPDGTATTTEGDEGTAKTDAPKADPAEPAAAEKPAATAKAAVADDDDDDDVDFEDSPAKWIEAINRNVPPRRYAYVLGAIIGGTGLVFAYQAQGEAKRAETITSALEAQRAVNNARASAAVANVMYGLAATAVVIALVLEFIPEPLAEKAALTFRF